MRWPWKRGAEDRDSEFVIRDSEPPALAADPFVPTKVSAPSDHELHVKAHHENLVRIRALDPGPERDLAFGRHSADAEDIRAFKRLNFSQEALRAQFWQLQFQIEDIKAQSDKLRFHRDALVCAGASENSAEIREIVRLFQAAEAPLDELCKHRAHIVYALNRLDGSPGGPVGHTGVRPARVGSVGSAGSDLEGR